MFVDSSKLTDLRAAIHQAEKFSLVKVLYLWSPISGTCTFFFLQGLIIESRARSKYSNEKHCYIKSQTVKKGNKKIEFGLRANWDPY